MSRETKKTRTPKKAEEAAPKPAETAPVEQQMARRFREGVVVKDKMDKTRIVEVTRLIQHPQFKKVVRSKVKYAVHDEKNEAKAGDKVRIMETRPLSKTKRWRLVKVLGK